MTLSKQSGSHSGVPEEGRGGGEGCLKSPPGPQSEGGPKMRNLTIAAMTGQAKSSGPKTVKGPIYIWNQKFGAH